MFHSTADFKRNRLRINAAIVRLCFRPSAVFAPLATLAPCAGLSDIAGVSSGCWAPPSVPSALSSACLLFVAPGAHLCSRNECSVSFSYSSAKKTHTQTWRDGAGFFWLVTHCTAAAVVLSLWKRRKEAFLLAGRASACRLLSTSRHFGKGGGANAASFVWGCFFLFGLII